MVWGGVGGVPVLLYVVLPTARVVSCKSAKDRTAMSVTLEHAFCLREYHKLQVLLFT